jgi:tripartite-type tricarboxylate transporter receptor subunit TctC
MTSIKTMALAAVAACALSSAAFAQGYPSKPITVVMPFAGGSGSDVAARIVFAKMASNMGQPIIVDNKPGAGGNIGTAMTAKAAPDGYTLVGAASGPFAANLTLYKDLGYDPQKDFTMISPFVSFTVVITASAKLGLNSVQDLIERAKKEPGALNYGSVGVGSSQHLAGEYFAQVTGTKLTHVPYRNIAQFGPDMIAGTVPLGFAWYPNVAGPIQSNGAKPLAVAGDKRLAVVADTPTTTEAKLPEYKVDGWFGLAAPAGVPTEILERLNKELNAALNDAGVRASFEKVGAVPFGKSLDESKTFLAGEIAKYRDIITKAGIAKIE